MPERARGLARLSFPLLGRQRRQNFETRVLAVRLGRGALDWLLCRFGRQRLQHAQFEDLVHRFAASIDQTDDPAVVEAELLRVVRRLAPSSRIEIVPEGDSQRHDMADDPDGAPESSSTMDGSSQRMLEIPLRCGASICARLRIRPRAGGPSSYRIEEVRRLTTLGTIAACAMEGLGLFTEWPEIDSLHTQGRRRPPPIVPTPSSIVLRSSFKMPRS